MKLRVTMVRAATVEIEVPEDFDPGDDAGQDLFEQVIEEKLKEGLPWPPEKEALVTNVTSTADDGYTGDPEDLLELID